MLPPSLEQREFAATHQTATALSNEQVRAEWALKVLFQGFDLLEGIPVRRRWWDAVFRLFSRSANSLLVAGEAVRRGYPVQGQVLVRAAYEHFLTAAYIQKKPRAARFWLAQKYANERFSRQIPSFDRMYREIFGTAAKNADDTYAILSQLAHPRPAGVRLSGYCSSCLVSLVPFGVADHGSHR